MSTPENVMEEMDLVIREALAHKSKSNSDTALEILSMAITIEKLAKDHYLDMAKKVVNKTGNVMFKYLAIEETGHIKELTVQEEALKRDGKWLVKERVSVKNTCPVALPEDREIKTIGDIVPKGQVAWRDMTDLDALRMGIEVKKRAIQFYCAAASKISDTYGKKMFAYLIENENRHLNELMVQYSWLDKTGFWYDPGMMTD